MMNLVLASGRCQSPVGQETGPHIPREGYLVTWPVCTVPCLQVSYIM